MPYALRLASSYCLLFLCIFLFFPSNHDALQSALSMQETRAYYAQKVEKSSLAIEKENRSTYKAFGTMNKEPMPKEEASFDNILKLELEKQLNKQLHYQSSYIVRDLLSKESVPYNESASASLFDKTRQIDNALLQTALKLKMPLQNIKVKSSYIKSKEHVFYLYQRIYIDFPHDLSQKVWDKNLQEQLSLWANSAKLQNNKDSKNVKKAKVLVNNVATHELFYNYVEPLAKISIVIDDLGSNLDQIASFTSLEFPITFSILPDMRHASKLATIGHFAGKEILLHQPMEDIERKFIERSSLLNNDTKEQLRAKFLRNLEKVPFAIGLNNHTGSGFTANASSVQRFLEVILEENSTLCVLDSVTTGKTRLHDLAQKNSINTARRSVFLDNIEKEEEILKQLDLVLEMALADPSRHVIAIGHPYKATIKALKSWEGYKNENVTIVDVF